MSIAYVLSMKVYSVTLSMLLTMYLVSINIAILICKFSFHLNKHDGLRERASTAVLAQLYITKWNKAANSPG